jgi:hypothetical protein
MAMPQVVFFNPEDEAEIDLVLRAWAILYQREILNWKPTSAPALYSYDSGKKFINRYDHAAYHDQLETLLEFAKLREDLGRQQPGK